MKNKILILLIFLCSSFLGFSNVEALEVGQLGYINSKEQVVFKSEANYGGNFLLGSYASYLETGDEVKLLNTTLVTSTNTDTCKTGFYNVSFYWTLTNKTYNGYVCSDVLNMSVDVNKYAEELNKFPESYRVKLAALKDAHQNWNFTPFNTGLDWNTSVNAESAVGTSYIQTSNPIYLSLAGGSYDPATKTYIQKEAGGFYAANSQTVSYYMDPRNFFNELDIFQFENLGYNSTYQTKNVLETIFSGTDLLQYSDYFINAATYDGNNISPIFLAARSRQEIVLSTGKISDSANGLNSKYPNTYNFYNIGAYSSCSNPIECGLSYAKDRGWINPEIAISMGAKFISSEYIVKKQNTLYFQRWNVVSNPASSNYSHQYMTNVEAPYSEGRSTYNGYKKITGLLDSSIEFVIPVYNNMPSTAASKPTAVDQTEIDKIEEDSNQSEGDLDVAGIVNGAGYRYDDATSISNLVIGTKASNLISKIKSMNGNATLSITSDGNTISGDEVLGTGDLVNINGTSLRIVVYGDVDGDGDVDILDLLRVQKYLLNSINLSGSYHKASDINKDGKVEILDLLKIQKHLLGSSNIEQ